ncbi:MAG: amidohydrolase family protein [Candidatus Thermoplasmatota archaeon]|nr:amidohydrolase family protein [Candidatus Thermoplasmatota archaeon]
MVIIAGDIFNPQTAEFFDGYIEIEKNIIIRTGKGNAPKMPDKRGTILPLFFNWHTHSADIIARSRIQKSERKWTIEELVGPEGEKHKILEETRDPELVSAMRQAMWEMLQNGVGGFCDFREGGLHGVELLNKALLGQKIACLRMARPAKNIYDVKEMNMMLNSADGIGISSISDWDYSELQKVAKHAKNMGKKIAIHASERIREDIDLVLDLKPDILVHMVKGAASDFSKVAQAKIPVVVCPRSNAFFGIVPPVDKMRKAGIEIKVGTDNAMISSFNMFDELQALRSISKLNPIESIKACTPDNLFNGKLYTLSEGANPAFMLLGCGKKGLASARSVDIKAIFL